MLFSQEFQLHIMFIHTHTPLSRLNLNTGTVNSTFQLCIPQVIVNAHNWLKTPEPYAPGDKKPGTSPGVLIPSSKRQSNGMM